MQIKRGAGRVQLSGVNELELQFHDEIRLRFRVEHATKGRARAYANRASRPQDEGLTRAP
jgi:hypothetical protein